MCVAGLSHLALSVAHLETTIDFCCNVLGGKLVLGPVDGASDTSTRRMALVGFGSFGLDLYEHMDNGSESFDPRRTGLDHVGFAVESADELKAWAQTLDAHGVVHAEIRQLGKSQALAFDDPDGIQLEFFFVG
jgi:glyoxylase I family protein